MKDPCTVVNLSAAPITIREEYDGDKSGECRKRRCKYFSRLSKTCDYYLITKKRRSAVCPPGAACTVCERGRRAEAGSERFNQIPNDKK